MLQALVAAGLLGVSLPAEADPANAAPVVVLPADPSARERHAARELARYLGAMSGQDIPVVPEGGALEETQPAIYVGRTVIGSYRVPDDLASEGFVIRAILDHLQPRLVICGGSDVGTLYGVYHALQELWGVGFLWDGEHVPRVERVEWGEVDLREEPRFRIRQNLQGCAFGYTTPYWGWEEWKAELDWTVKHGFNTLMLPWQSVDREVWRQFGLELGPRSENEVYRLQLMQRVAGYARRLGVKCILPGFGGAVPRQFAEQHPEARLVDVKWGEAAAIPHLFPSDPWFRRIGEACVREYARLYGTDHIYNVDPYPETQPGANEQEKAEIKRAFAESVVAYLAAADPQAVWYASGWTFLDQGFWPEEAVADFLSRIPKGRFYVNDIWAEAVPIHERLNYFDGHDWGFSVLHSFGGDDQMHGDLGGLVQAVRKVAADPRADHCVAFYINPEMIHYNVLHFELAARLGWNPAGVEVDRYLDEYVDLRYGRDAPASARSAIKTLAGTVYGSTPGHEPAWQRRPSGAALQPADLAAQRSLPVPLGAEAALLVRERALLADNPLYQRDCLDVTRQYAAELFNRLHALSVAAYAAGDREALARCTGRAEELMAGVEALLATRDDYRVQPIVDAALRMPGNGPEEERAVKDGMLTFAGPMSWLIDYQSKDLQELLAGYYAPRMGAFYRELRTRAAGGRRDLPTGEEMLPTYREIEQAWLDTPVSTWSRRSARQPAEAAAELLGRLHRIEAALQQQGPLADARPGDAIGWEEDFSDLRDWHETYAGGTFQTEGGIASLTSQTKWCLFGADPDVPISEYPVLSFRYRTEEPARKGVWIWVTWTNAAGQPTRSLVWNQGLSEEWQEVHLDLEALLRLVGSPVRLQGIELNNQEPPHRSQWDWMRLSSRAGGEAG